MKKFYLKTVKNCCKDNNIIEIDGFVKAEKKAIMLYKKLIENDVPNIETYVCLCENLRDAMYLDSDCYIIRQDTCGNMAWYKRIYGTYCCLCERLTTKEEDAELEEWRNEVELHIYDLPDEKLKKLRREICVGSCYIDDYDNSFNINTQEVYDYADKYEKYIEEFELEDTPQNFAKYIMENTYYKTIKSL